MNAAWLAHQRANRDYECEICYGMVSDKKDIRTINGLRYCPKCFTIMFTARTLDGFGRGCRWNPISGTRTATRASTASRTAPWTS